MTVKSVDVLVICADAITGMTSVRGKNGVALVIAIDPREIRLNQMQLERLSDGLKAAGINAIVINHGCQVHAVGRDQTFFRAGYAPLCQVVADGRNLDRVKWCETSHGLVCTIEQDGRLLVRQYASVEVVPLDGVPAGFREVPEQLPFSVVDGSRRPPQESTNEVS